MGSELSRAESAASAARAREDHAFVRLLEEERNTLCAPKVLPFVQSQARMWRLPLLAMEDVFSAINANWQRNLGVPRKAA